MVKSLNFFYRQRHPLQWILAFGVPVLGSNAYANYKTCYNDAILQANSRFFGDPHTVGSYNDVKAKAWHAYVEQLQSQCVPDVSSPSNSNTGNPVTAQPTGAFHPNITNNTTAHVAKGDVQTSYASGKICHDIGKMVETTLTIENDALKSVYVKWSNHAAVDVHCRFWNWPSTGVNTGKVTAGDQGTIKAGTESGEGISGIVGIGGSSRFKYSCMAVTDDLDCLYNQKHDATK